METMKLSYDEKHFNRPVITISKEFLTELEKVSSNSSFLETMKRVKRKQGEKEEYDFPIGEFEDLFRTFFESTDWSLENQTLHLPKIPHQVKEAYLEAREEYLAFRGKEVLENGNPLLIRDYHFPGELLEEKIYEEDLVSLEKMIRSAMKVQKENETLYRFRDFFQILDRTFQSFSYFPEKPDLEPYQKRIEAFQKEGNLDGCLQVLRELQKEILNHWQTFTTDIYSFKPGQPFRFLCHSTSTVNYQGEFLTRYVSTSLLTEKLTDTYRSGFGFIMEPNHIVGASSQDMYVKNGADSREELGMVTMELALDGPEKVIADCLKQKEENDKNQNHRSVYSEIVIDGFAPAAIFCLTNGSKELNVNYVNAKKLQECFPNLEIIEMDLTLYREEDWEMDCENVITAIESEGKIERQKQNLEYCRRFTRFWKEFQEMKKRPDYTKEEIVQSYEKNKQLIVSFLPISKLLKEYDVDTIRYVLNNNVHYDIPLFMKQKKTVNGMENFYFQFLGANDKNTLNFLIPGLGTFMEIYPHLSWTEELLEKWNEKTFSSMLEVVAFMEKNLETSKKHEQENLEKQMETYSLLLKEYQEESSFLEERKKDDWLVQQEYYYHIASLDIQFDSEEKERQDQRKQEKEKEIFFLQSEKSQKEQEKKTLMKRRMFHRRKLQEIERKIQFLESEISFQEKELASIVEKIKEIDTNLSNSYQKFQEQIGVDFASFPSVLESAKKRLEGVSIFEEEWKLSKLEEKVQSLQGLIQKIQGKITTLKEIGGMKDDISIHIGHSAR